MRIIFLFSILLLSCGRNTDFLYHYNPPPKDRFSFNHVLKEMQGNNLVDMLWIVDNSASMYDHQMAIAKSTDSFMTLFTAKGGIDWKMGVISTDEGQQPFLGFTKLDELTFKTPKAVDIFKNAIKRLSTNGSGLEKTFTPISAHLTNYPDFVRKGAVLAIISVTDAPEQSQMSAADFLQRLIKIKGDIKNIVMYGIYSPLDFSCMATDDRWNYAGSPYEEVIKKTNGKVYSLCSGDFGVELAKLGKDLVSRIDHPYIQLKKRPYPATIRVSYQGKDLKGGRSEDGAVWIYDFDLNRIVFYNLDFAPSENEQVNVSYDEA